jgi:hypothetical protein
MEGFGPLAQKLASRGVLQVCTVIHSLKPDKAVFEDWVRLWMEEGVLKWD